MGLFVKKIFIICFENETKKNYFALAIAKTRKCNIFFKSDIKMKS